MKIDTLDYFKNYIMDNVGEGSVDVDLNLSYINGEFYIKNFEIRYGRLTTAESFSSKYPEMWYAAAGTKRGTIKKEYDELPEDLFEL